jgi:L-fucose isomerase-like protein
MERGEFGRRGFLSKAGALAAGSMASTMCGGWVRAGQVVREVSLTSHDARGVVRVKPVFVGIIRPFPWNHPTPPVSKEELRKRASEMVHQFKRELDLDFVNIEKPFLISRHEDYRRLTAELTHNVDAILVGAYRTSSLDSLPLERYGLPTISPDVRSDFLRALRVKKYLTESKIVYVGEFPSISVGTEGTRDFYACAKRFGIRMRQIETGEFYRHFDSLSVVEVEQALLAWKNDFSDVNGPTEQHLMDMTRAYLALRNLAREEDASGLCVNCNTLYIPDTRHVVPCMAFNRLIDEGVMCGCEGDLGAMVSALILHAVSGGQAVLMGNFRLRPEEDILFIQHGIIPLSMARSKYRVHDYHGKGWGVTAYADAKTGPMTILNISPSYGQICVIEGSIKDSFEPEAKLGMKTCRFRVNMSVKDGHVKEVPSIMVGTNHHSMTLGHWQAALVEAGELLNLEVRHLA